MTLRPRKKSAPDIYLYGMIVLSTIHRLAADYPEADGYGEIEETHVVPGGETGNSALILARLGHRVKVGGPFLGTQTRTGVLAFLRQHGIDCSGLHYDAGFDGVRDLVLVGGKTRPSSAASPPTFAAQSAGRLPTNPPSPPPRLSALIPFSEMSRSASPRVAPRSAGAT